MKFYYKAIKDGRATTGHGEAKDKEAFAASLTKQGLHPLVIKVDKAKGGGLLSFFGPSKKVKLSDLVIFTRQLSTMISAGVPLARSLSALQADSESPRLREALASLTKDVEGGMALGDAFAKYPDIFNEVYVNMVRAGEE